MLIPATNFGVDCFKTMPNGIEYYFLTHFHSDHYIGLRCKFKNKIVCSQTTANLVNYKFKIPYKQIIVINPQDSICINNVKITAIDSFHCPGALAFVFDFNGKTYLHTGDFRATPIFYNNLDSISMLRKHYNTIFLDNTFENSRSFPSQTEVITNVIKYVSKIIKVNKNDRLVPFKYVFIFCAYSIGKEKLFLSIAEYFDFKVQVSQDKMKIMKCYSQKSVDDLNQQVSEIINFYKHKENNVGEKLTPFDRISTSESNFKIVGLNSLNRDRLNKVVKNVACDRVLVILGTGWAGKPKYFDLIRKNKTIKKGIEMIQVPYSEHSSHDELNIFKANMKYDVIKNTVKNKSSNF